MHVTCAQYTRGFVSRYTTSQCEGFILFWALTAFPFATTAPRGGAAENKAVWDLVLAIAVVGDILSHHDFFSCAAGAEAPPLPIVPPGGGRAKAS